ncbi:MAG: PAS domain S-box protein [Bacillota bacterium]
MKKFMASPSGRGTTTIFEKTFNHAPVGTALVAPDGNWIVVNQALCGMLGYGEQELLAVSMRMLTYPRDLRCDRSQYSALIAGHIARYQTEKRFFHKNGALIWAAVSVSLVRDDYGCQDFYIYQFADITEKKRRETRQQVFFDHASHLFVVVDANGYVAQANTAWTKALGWTSTELAQRRLIDLVHPEDRDTIASPKRCMSRYLAKNGGYRRVEWLTTVFQNGCFHYVARALPQES